jgi:hypothetical protein
MPDPVQQPTHGALMDVLEKLSAQQEKLVTQQEKMAVRIDGIRDDVADLSAKVGFLDGVREGQREARVRAETGPLPSDPSASSELIRRWGQAAGLLGGLAAFLIGLMEAAQVVPHLLRAAREFLDHHS